MISTSIDPGLHDAQEIFCTACRRSQLCAMPLSVYMRAKAGCAGAANSWPTNNWFWRLTWPVMLLGVYVMYNETAVDVHKLWDSLRL